MPNNNPLTVFYKLFSELILLFVQICWQAVLFVLALIPCGAAIHPSLPCKVTPWTLGNSRHRCRCPSLTVTPSLTSVSSGLTRTWTNSRCHPPFRPPPLQLSPPRARSRRGRAARRSRAGRTRVSPSTLAARLERHLLPHMVVPTPTPAVTPPPPYKASASPRPQPEESVRKECSESKRSVDTEQCSSTLPPARGEASPPSPPLPPRRRRRPLPPSGCTPSAPPDLMSATSSDTE